MPQPTQSQVHVDKPLTDLSLAYIQDENDYISQKVFPFVGVQKKSDVYFTYPKGQWFRNGMKKRAPGTESAGSGYDLDTAQYLCDKFALHKDISDDIRANQDDPVDMDRDASRWLTQQGLISQEVEWASAFFGTGLWTGSSTGTDIVPAIKWDAASSDPVKDVTEQSTAQKRKTGFRPNKMVVSADVDTALRNNEEIKERIKYVMKVTTDDITPGLLASLFGMQEYMVADAIVNTSTEGAADSMDFIVGSGQAALYYVPPAAGIMIPSAGYTFGWNGLLGANARGTTISTFRMEHLKSDRVEIEQAFDQKQIAADLGVFFTTVLT